MESAVQCDASASSSSSEEEMQLELNHKRKERMTSDSSQEGNEWKPTKKDENKKKRTAARKARKLAASPTAQTASQASASAETSATALVPPPVSGPVTPESQQTVTTDNQPSEVMKLMCYITGARENVGLLATKKGIATKKEIVQLIGENDSMKITGKSIRVKCINDAQKQRLMTMTSLMGHEVGVTGARGLEAVEAREGRGSEGPRGGVQRGIIFGVSLDDTDEEVKEAIGALSVRRLMKREGEGRVPTTTVVFDVGGDQLPEFVYVGCMRKRVKLYIPNPMRCFKCQAFGHTSTRCNATKAKCARCGGAHGYEQCDKIDTPTCPNCKGPHSAGYRGCPVYQQTQEILEIKVTGRLSYAAAVKQWRNEDKLKKATAAAGQGEGGQGEGAQGGLASGGGQGGATAGGG